MNNKIETNSLTFFIACGKKSWRKSEREMKRVQGKAHVVRVRAKRGIEGSGGPRGSIALQPYRAGDKLLHPSRSNRQYVRQTE